MVILTASPVLDWTMAAAMLAHHGKDWLSNEPSEYKITLSEADCDVLDLVIVDVVVQVNLIRSDVSPWKVCKPEVGLQQCVCIRPSVLAVARHGAFTNTIHGGVWNSQDRAGEVFRSKDLSSKHRASEPSDEQPSAMGVKFLEASTDRPLI